MTASSLPLSDLPAAGPAAARPAAPGVDRPLSVGVIVDLVWGPWAGGHVKCWERIAAAAAAMPRELDVTVHYLGEKSGTVELADNVRFQLHRPLINTKWLGFTDNRQNHTCLAPYHAGLSQALAQHDIVHATGAFFSLAKTGLRHARRNDVPLVYSFHTDTVAYTRHYSREILKRWFGDGAILRFLVDKVRYDQISGDRMQRVLDHYLQQCDWVLASKPEDRSVAERVVSSERVSYLRRGIDRGVFAPQRRDRGRLLSSYGIAEDRFVVMFVGRVDDAKNVMTVARATKRLVEAGAPIHLAIAGTGSRAADVRALLGDAVTLCGQVEPDTLGWLYASADVFAFPSEFEIMPNVVNEARACGLPVLVSQNIGGADLIDPGGVDGLRLPGRDPAAWAEAIGALMRDRGRWMSLAEAGLRRVAAMAPGWDDVLRQDLLPVWRRVIEERRSAGVRQAYPAAGAAPG
ncbi:MAG: glycosyltransferase [Alphaproteobacteria bacterium]|nr:glycosyltransferase [Alphaproteobacteria bacterium]